MTTHLTLKINRKIMSYFNFIMYKNIMNKEDLKNIINNTELDYQMK